MIAHRRTVHGPALVAVAVLLLHCYMILQTVLVVTTTTSTAVMALASASSSSPQRYALVTGGNKGIGKEIARQLGSDPDLTCIIACRDVRRAERAAAELQENPVFPAHDHDHDDEDDDAAEVDDDDVLTCDVVALPIPLDLTDHDSIAAAAAYVAKEYGGTLDILVNNAAICFNDPTLYGKCEYTEFRDQAEITINTNYFGTLQVTNAFLPLLKKSRSPRIINIASAAGRLTILRSKELVETVTSDALTTPQLNNLMKQFVADVQDGTHTERGWPNTCYGVSKLGIIAFTRILAREHPEMMVNSVDPGYCKTDQNNNQGTVLPGKGAFTPYLLANMDKQESDDDEVFSGLHFFEESEMPWTYQ